METTQTMTSDVPEGEDAERILRLDALGGALAESRTAAIAWRTNSGIEYQWTEDEEYYAGIDDANRDEGRNAFASRPPGQEPDPAGSSTRSTVFINITRPYVDAAAARIADMLLPTDDRNWALNATPVPDLVDIAGGNLPPDIEAALNSVPGATQPDVEKMQGAVIDQAKQILDEAERAAKKAEKRIEDWTVEGQYNAEVRRVIEDTARCGAGVIKGPIPVKRRRMALVDADKQQEGAPEGDRPSLLHRLYRGIKKAMGFVQAQVKALIVQEKVEPASRRIDFWDLFPDPACGENLHNGGHIWERDRLTERQLRDLIGMDGVVQAQIERCLEEGPQKAIGMPKKAGDGSDIAPVKTDDGRFEIWYFTGALKRKELLAAGCECEEGETESVYAVISMVNDHVIRSAMNPLDNGEFPYDIMPWQRKRGSPWGNGVARQGRTPQRIVNGAGRHLMDNGGLSSGPQILIDASMIEPADKKWILTPRKLWRKKEGADIDDVRKAMVFFEVPSRQQELMAIIELGLRLMEDSTGLPMLLQGQLGKAPDTVGGMTLLNNNASAVLRRLARTFDDCVTTPHIRRYYDWLLIYGKDDEKGDFTIEARGSTALVERDLQAQEIIQMASIVVNPLFGLDPKKWASELLKSRKFSPKNFEFDDEQWKQIVENMSKGPADPRTQVAQLNADAKLKAQQAEQAFEASEAGKDRQLELIKERINERIEAMKEQGAKEINFEELKAMLAEVAIKVSAQKELSAVSLAVDVHKHHVPAAVMTPPTEPVGRARAGRAYQQ